MFIDEQQLKSIILADGTDLTLWADRREAQALLPKLLRRLIHRTVKQIINLDFPAGEGVQLSGLDGNLLVTEGNEYVPTGQSAWECSTRSDIGAKADSDYEKRCRNPRGIDPTQSTFVFVTPRRWRGKNDWVKTRKSEGIWRDVRAYDADNIEAWLELAPAVHIWLSNLLGKHPENAIDLDNFWADWSESTQPAMQIEFVLSGRLRVVEQIHAWLRHPTEPLALKTESRIEAVAVFAAAVHLLPSEEKNYHLFRAIVVYDLPAWYRLAVPGEPRILIPMFDGLDATTRATRNGHQVVIPLGRADTEIASTIRIPKLSREEAAKILVSCGLAEDRARTLASLAHNSMTAFRRRLSSRPEILQPEWARPEKGASLIPAMLAGAWNDNKEGDQQAIGALAQVPYEDFILILQRWSLESDPPIRHVGDTWSVISKYDIWSLLTRYLTKRVLECFEVVALDVLSSPDPRFDLPVDQRWMAGAFGASPQHSSSLYEGFAETLAIMGAHGDIFPQLAEIPLHDYATWIVRRLFERTHGDWRVWATLSMVLPFLAEAAPDSLLTAIDEGCEGERPILLQLFTDQEETLFFSSPHTGLLWALETLAWNPEYFGYASLILAKLSRLDPGGKLSNRPLNSLHNIFHLRRPQSKASLEQRLRVLDTIRQNEPNVAWQLLCKLLPKHHDVLLDTRRPRWRDWAPDSSPITTLVEYVNAVHEVVIKLLSDVGENGYRWSDIIEALPMLPEDEYDAVLDQLASVDIQHIESSDRVIIWGTLRKLLSRHRSFPEAGWALPTRHLEQLDELYQKFEPQELVERYGWLFDYHPAHPDGYEADYETHQEIVLRDQLIAVREIFTNLGFQGILDILSNVNRPDVLGSTLGRTEFLEDLEDEILQEYLASDEDIYAQFARGFTHGRIMRQGREWADSKLVGVANEWTPTKREEFLTCLPRDERTWEIAESFDSETERGYWIRVYPYGISEQDYERAARKLIEYNRPCSAIGLISMNVRRGDPFPATLVVEALEHALQISPEDDPPLSTFSYHVSELFDKLEASREIEESRIALLEWAYLPIIEHHKRTPKILHRELARNPKFFADVIELVFTAEGEEQREFSEEDKIKARRGFELLNSWHTVPGSADDGTIDVNLLKGWVRRARELTASTGHRVIGDQMIGQVLSGSPSGTDGVWPHPAVCDVVEELANNDLERGFEIGLINSRGAVFELLKEGGVQEHKLAERYNNFASAIRESYPRTSTMLRRVADRYRARARTRELMVRKLEDEL